MATSPLIPCRSCGVGIKKSGRCEACTARREGVAYEPAKNKTKTAANQKAYDERRGSAASRGYGRKWRIARISFLLQNPLCIECKANNKTTAASVVDHIIPHRQDRNLFNDQSNWQPMCKTCHDRKTMRGE